MSEYFMFKLLPFFKRFPNIDEKFPMLFNAGDPGTMRLKKKKIDIINKH